MKSFLVYIWRLAVVIALATGGGAELQRGAADLVTRTSPRMLCEFLDWIGVNFYSISVCTAGEEIVYRRQKVLSQTLTPAGEETIELPASTIRECAKLATEAGLAAFEFNSKCLAYSSSNRFRKCYIFCYRVIYVTSHSFPKTPRLVTLDEAPWKPGPYNDTREYRLEKLIYLDEENVPQPGEAGQPYEPPYYRSGYSYATLQNGATLTLMFADVDLSTCLYYDGDAGLPTLVSPVFYNHAIVPYHFMESCGKTLIFPSSSTVDDLTKPRIVLYSHRGYGCSEFPGKTDVDCTVNIEINDDVCTAQLYTDEFHGPDGGCDGFTLTMEEGGVEKDVCAGDYLKKGRYAFTVRGSAPDSRVGFYIFVRGCY